VIVQKIRRRRLDLPLDGCSLVTGYTCVAVNSALVLVRRALPQFVQNLVNAEAARLLARREVLGRGKELANDCLRRDEYKCIVEQPVVISVRRDVRRA